MTQKNCFGRRCILGSLRVVSCRQGLGLGAGNQEAGIAGAGLELELAMKLKKVGGGAGGSFVICFFCTKCRSHVSACLHSLLQEHHLSHVMSEPL